MISWNANFFGGVTGPCCGNSPVTSEFPSQRLLKRSFIFFLLRLNKRLSKKSWGWWFETSSLSLWCHRKTCKGWSVVGIELTLILSTPLSALSYSWVISRVLNDMKLSFRYELHNWLWKTTYLSSGVKCRWYHQSNLRQCVLMHPDFDATRSQIQYGIYGSMEFSWRGKIQFLYPSEMGWTFWYKPMWYQAPHVFNKHGTSCLNQQEYGTNVCKLCGLWLDIMQWTRTNNHIYQSCLSIIFVLITTIIMHVVLHLIRNLTNVISHCVWPCYTLWRAKSYTAEPTRYAIYVIHDDTVFVHICTMQHGICMK